MKLTAEIENLKKTIEKLPSEKISEVSEYLGSLVQEQSQPNSQRIQNLEGIWEGLGFETLDIEKEISNLCSDIDRSILRK